MKTNKGFTLIELLVVIAIIGVLATMVVGSISNARISARDAQRKSDLNQIRTAIISYALENNLPFSLMGSGCGVGGNGQGFYDAPYTSYSSIQNCLVNAGLISRAVMDPRAGGRYMMHRCGSTSSLFIMARLEGDSPTDSPCAYGVDTQYQMNYFIELK